MLTAVLAMIMPCSVRVVHVNSRVHTRTHARATWHRANTAVCTYMGDMPILYTIGSFPNNFFEDGGMIIAS